MEPLKHREPFGKVHIPPQSNSELTASYTASDWGVISTAWNLTMFWTVPEMAEPIEKSSVTLMLKSRSEGETTRSPPI